MEILGSKLYLFFTPILVAVLSLRTRAPSSDPKQNHLEGKNDHNSLSYPGWRNARDGVPRHGQPERGVPGGDVLGGAVPVDLGQVHAGGEARDLCARGQGKDQRRGKHLTAMIPKGQDIQARFPS